MTEGDEVKKVPHKCAAIFIDNSGVDVVLGVIPFVQFLLGRGTEVILCANNRPVLNDVTYAELVTLVQVTNKYCLFLWHLNHDDRGHKVLSVLGNCIGPARHKRGFAVAKLG